MDSFMDYLTSGLTIFDLLYVNDSSLLPAQDYDKVKLEKNKVKVWVNLINRNSMSYHSKVTNSICDPLKIKNK